MKKLVLIALCFTFLVAWTFGSPQMDYDNWEAVNPISPKYGNSEELAARFSHWPNYKGAYDIMRGAKTALRWCKMEASNNYMYRSGKYKADEPRNYRFYGNASAKGAPLMKPSDPEWVKDCTECMDALGFKYVGPEE